MLSLAGRISRQRTDGGTYGSWSWTESNFHQQDVMDVSYTDTSYKPVYTLDGYSSNTINTGTNIKRVVESMFNAVRRSKECEVSFVCPKTLQISGICDFEHS